MVSLQGEALDQPERLEAMGRSLRLRGPDGRGCLRRGHFALGHERLRVVDLHKRADQPFDDPESRCHLVCNGEIYNSESLRRRYRDYPFRSRCDVETILPLYLDRGVEGLSELDGMFAMVLWDESTRTLTMGRDRAGEKPLFYRRMGKEVWFASEVQTLLSGRRDLDEAALRSYLTLGYVPEPRTMFAEVRKLSAGTFVSFTAQGESLHRYWQPDVIASASVEAESAGERLRDLLRAAVRKQAVAEVPVGVFLSGGLDSSLLASLAVQETAGQRLHTFAARFTEDSYDEADWAAQHARHLGTEHREVQVDESSLAQAFQAVAENLAEPLADPAILPTYLLGREARNHVKVVLSGEGADELFGGYPTYLGHNLTPWVRALPLWIRGSLRRAADHLPTSHRKVTLEYLVKRFLAAAEEPCWIERHLKWMGPGLQGLLASGGEPGAGQPAAASLSFLPFSPARDGASGAMLLDYCSYLRDNLLVKVDRAVMMSSVETRTPFLDRDLAAFALAMPDPLKIRRLETKTLLKSVALEWLPRALVYRRKRGLSVPISAWINNGLRGEADRLLAPERLQRQDILDPKKVTRMLDEHRRGQIDHGRGLWALIVLQSWLERWLPERAG